MSYIKTARHGGVAEIILDRPKALNALDQSMIDDLDRVLREFADDDSVASVLVTSASDRAFCAGGDIRAIRDNALAGNTAAITEYFSSEYRVDLLIAEYPKPYIAVIDGAAMGGGLGISVHGEIRIVTEKALIAMPETAIGFFPDIGSTYFLSRLPAGVGNYLGLTGSRIVGADAVAVGLATHFVPSDKISGFLADFRESGDLAATLATYAEKISTTEVPLAKIAEYFVSSSVPAIIGGLKGSDDPWAAEVLQLFANASPNSLVVTAALIEKGATSTLVECFDRELAAAEIITATTDFAEGVRAVLVDKDKNPNFSPADISDVDPAFIAKIVNA